MRNGYSTSDAAVVCGLSERQVRLLSAAGGPAQPSLKAPSGRGSLVLFTTRDLTKMACLAKVERMLGGGLRGRWVQQAAAALDNAEDLTGGTLVLDDEGAHVTSPEGAELIASTADAVLLVRLGSLSSQVRSQVARKLAVAA